MKIEFSTTPFAVWLQIWERNFDWNRNKAISLVVRYTTRPLVQGKRCWSTKQRGFSIDYDFSNWNDAHVTLRMVKDFRSKWYTLRGPIVVSELK